MAADRHKLRVLIVGLNYEPEASGIAPYTSGMARGLAERGHEVRVITGYPHYPQWKVHAGYRGRAMTESIGGARVKRVQHYVPRHPATANRVLMEVAFGFRAITSRWGRPDVVVVVSPALVSSCMTMMRARLTRVPVVTWVQDIYTLGIEHTSGNRLTRLVRALERNLLAHSARVVVIHSRFRDYLQRDLKTQTSIAVVRNWSHVAPAPAFDRAAVRRSHGWAADEIVVLHAGNLGAKQGLENVVRASRMVAERGIRIRFVLMGDGLRGRILKKLDPNSHLQFIDPLPDGSFEQALGAADVLLVNEMPGLTEMSVPSKLTTYWATGRPVVAAVDRGSTTADELVGSRAGVLVEPAKPAALVDAIVNLVADPQRCHDLAEAGKLFCDRYLNEQVGIDSFESVLRRVVNPAVASDQGVAL